MRKQMNKNEKYDFIINIIDFYIQPKNELVIF